MGRQTSYRNTADVLRKTIQKLEDDPTIDTNGAAFIDLKCNLLNRILELETGKARAEAVIHLVNTDNPAVKSSEEQKPPDSAIA